MKPAHSSQETPLSEDLLQPQAQHASQRDRERVAASALCFMRMLGEPAEKKRRKKKKRRLQPERCNQQLRLQASHVHM